MVREMPMRDAKRKANQLLASPMSRRGKAARRDTDSLTPPPARLRKKPKPVFAVQPSVTPFTRDFDMEWLHPMRVMIFGQGNSGQFGLGTDYSNLGEKTQPKLQTTFKKWAEADGDGDNTLGERKQVEDLACGGAQSLFVDSAGKVWSCGSNDEAQLARSTVPNDDEEADEQEARPGLVQGLPDSYSAQRVFAGDSFGVLISSQGLLMCWGSFRTSEGALKGIGFDGRPGSSANRADPFTPTGLENARFVQAATGNNHILALDDSGQVWSWGIESNHCLGRPVENLRHSTRRVAKRDVDDRSAEEKSLQPALVDGLKNILFVACGAFCSYAVDKQGHVWAWGENSNGQLALPASDAPVTKPTKVPQLTFGKGVDGKIIKIAGGEMHALFLSENGSVYAAGRAEDGQLGISESDAEPMKGLNAEYQQTKKANSDAKEAELARLQAESDDPAASLGDDDKMATLYAEETAPVTRFCFDKPQLVTFPEEDDEQIKIVDIAVGTRANIALSSRGCGYTFGFGAESQLGQGQGVTHAFTPRILGKGLDSPFRILKCEAGGSHCMLLAAEQKPKPSPVLLIPASKAPGNGHQEANGHVDMEEVIKS